MLRCLPLLVIGFFSSLALANNVVRMDEFVAKRELKEVVGLYENTERYGEGFFVSVDVVDNKIVITSVEEGRPDAVRAEYPLTPGEFSRKITHPLIGKTSEFSVVIVDKGHYANRTTSEGSESIVEESVDVKYDGEELIIRIVRMLLNKDYKPIKDNANNFRDTLWLEKISSTSLNARQLEEYRLAQEQAKARRRAEIRASLQTEATILPFRPRSCKQLFN